MASCPNCQRNLPPNGKCLFCGGDDVRGGTSERKRSSSGIGLWVSWIIKLGLAVGLLAAAYWMIFTGSGQLWVESMQQKLGMAKKVREETPALKIMKALDFAGKPKYPKLVEKIADMSYTIEEEALTAPMKQVTFTRRDGADMFTATFQVNLQSGTVRAQDAAGGIWLK